MSPTKRSLTIDIVATAIGVGACLSSDRFSYMAGYKMWQDGQGLNAGGLLGALVLASVIVYRLFKSIRGPLVLTVIRLALLSVVTIYLVSNIRGPDKFLEGFRDRLIATFDPQSLQVWAMEILKHESIDNGEAVKSITQDRLPRELKELPRSPGILLQKDSQGKFIELMFGRRWGLYIGPPIFRLPLNYSCIEWIPGVYFYDAISK
jgi:hypothetical protein